MGKEYGGYSTAVTGTPLNIFFFFSKFQILLFTHVYRSFFSLYFALAPFLHRHPEARVQFANIDTHYFKSYRSPIA